MTVRSAIAKLASLMLSDLPQYIAPERLAKEGAHLEGQVKLHKMTRLAKLLNDSQGAVSLRLAFCRTESGLTCITGRYETDLQLTCQRCLEPVAVKLAHNINVAIAFEGVANKLPASVEPLVLVQDTILLADFIEEEILLGLPISPMHDLQECAAGDHFIQRDKAVSSPFHILKELRKS